MKRIVDPATTFVPAAERVFGRPPEVVEDGRALLFRAGEVAVKLRLEAGERELWVSLVRLVAGETPPLFVCAPTHERRVRVIEIDGSIERALHEVKEALDG
jgi:hypothetical protein